MQLDPKHESFDLFSDQIIQDIWREKYAQPNERIPADTFLRVADFVYMHDTVEHRLKAYEAMCKGLWMPGGRILAGAGTSTDVTLMNCYVCRDIEDSIQGINAAMGDAMTTLSKYGGIGMNFGTIRPSGAAINRVGLKAPGPIVFMELWNAMSNTIMQAGHRRGAMMGVMPDTHPDLIHFINAKHEKGRLTNFNISVLISDAFMRAVAADVDWDLHFHVPPAQSASSDIKCRTFPSNGKIQYVYSTHKARDLWDMILKSTYEYSEPGVIFIDRINALNNLQYCEEISCTNPCGEQPLPPNGTCNLGAVNLARIVKNPYTLDAKLDIEMLQEVVRIGVRFLDNVINVTHYPLQEQKEEEFNKRRLGLGVSGLADMLGQMRISYNSPGAVALTAMVMQTIAEAAYSASAELASARGTFPLYDKKQCISFPQRLSYEVRVKIAEHGLRNGVILTVAPTGTTSILFGNISSGIEPVFQHHTKRKVWISNTDTKEYTSWGFGARFYNHCHKMTLMSLPDYLVTVDNVELKYHLKMQAACQEWVDASISKTINCPPDIPYSDFKSVYWQAYESGCKGCTTYRPSDVRGSVLEKVEEPKIVGESGVEITYPDPPIGIDIPPTTSSKGIKRPEVLMGCTYRINWPSLESGVYLTINECEGQPWEIFISSKDLKNVEWTTALCIMTSRNLRAGEDPQKIAEELKEIKGAHDGQWVNGKYYASIVMYIGELLAKHFQYLGTEDRHFSGRTEIASGDGYPRQDIVAEAKDIIRQEIGFMVCPRCSARMVKLEGCEKCTSCSYSKCG